ncbi:MAG: MFS transporter [Pirellulales bacterium]
MMSTWQRLMIPMAVFAALLFDGVELGMMPIASLSVSKSLLGDDYTKTLGGDWFARFTAALMLGAAIGGILLGHLGDRIGRSRAMGVCILFYSVFASLGAFVQSQEQMLLLRFMVGLGVGGLWPNGIALVAECWPGTSRPILSGLMMAGLNAGILMLSQIARLHPISEQSWRWLFQFAGLPAILGVLVLIALPESPRWQVTKSEDRRPNLPILELFRPGLLRVTLVAMLLSSIPMIGAWSASKWMIPWADQVAENVTGYKAETQGWWALGATLGSFFGAVLAGCMGRRLSYFVISAATTVVTICMFQLTQPMAPSFHPIVFTQGLVATLFFGWLTMYLPEVFPVRVRASGAGLAFNVGRFATAIGVLAAGVIFHRLGGDYPRVGTICACIYGLGALAILFVPKHEPKYLQDNPSPHSSDG